MAPGGGLSSQGDRPYLGENEISIPKMNLNLRLVTQLYGNKPPCFDDWELVVFADISGESATFSRDNVMAAPASAGDQGAMIEALKAAFEENPGVDTIVLQPA